MGHVASPVIAHPMPDLTGLTLDSTADLVQTATAVFDPAGLYRYALTRIWATGTHAVFVLLNPSTATAFTTDATLRRCEQFARREHCAGLVIVNLFAWRATDPTDLLTAEDPVGARNDEFLRACTRHDGPTIAGWGTHGALRERAEHVVRGVLAKAELLCLGTTTGGHPRHPCRLRKDTPLIPFPGDAPGADVARHDPPSQP
jgi:hypothetical protein